MLNILIFALFSAAPTIAMASSCTNGEYKCLSDGKSFQHCSNGVFYSFSCPSVTVCKQHGSSISCNFPDNYFSSTFSSSLAPTTTISYTTVTAPTATVNAAGYGNISFVGNSTSTTTMEVTQTPLPSADSGICPTFDFRCMGSQNFQKCSNGVWYNFTCPSTLICNINGSVVCNYKADLTEQAGSSSLISSISISALIAVIIALI